MAGTSTNTTPTSCEVAPSNGIDSPLTDMTPTKLMLSESTATDHTFTSSYSYTVDASTHSTSTHNNAAKDTGGGTSPGGQLLNDNTRKTQDVASIDASDNNTVATIVRILGLSPETKEYLEKEYPTIVEFEEFMQLSSQQIMTASMQTDGKKRARFRQADRAMLILLRRWMKLNQVDSRQINWDALNRDSFDLAFVHKVDEIILDEILEELHLTKLKDSLREKGVYSPTKFVDKSKYWFKEIEVDDGGIHEIEKFKKWYKSQLDFYLPLDWVRSFRIDGMNEEKIEWRRVLKSVGLNDDVLHALKINDVHDFDTLNHMSKRWRIAEEPMLTSDDCALESSDSREWELMGLELRQARHIINFRHWYEMYVVGKRGMDNWTSDFHAKQYNDFVRRYINPSKPDEFKKPGWFKTRSMNNGLTTPKEKKKYLDTLQEAAEDGVVNGRQQYYLRQHYEERREKMELIQEINAGEGDISFQERRLREILEKDAQNGMKRKTEGLLFSQKLYQYVFSALLAYIFCFGYCTTTVYFMTTVEPPPDHNDGYQTAVFIHNILFGLVTSVVVQELSEKQNASNLYNRFLPIYRQELENTKNLRFKSFLNKNISFSLRNICYKLSGLFGALAVVFRLTLTWFVLYSTRIYILIWICCGAASLVYGVLAGTAPESVLYSTGQTWVALAVTIGHAYFGLSESKAPEEEEEEEKIAESTETGMKVAERDDDLDLSAQLAESKEEMEAAVEREDYEAIGNLARKVAKLKKKLEEEGTDGEGESQAEV